ncbi:MAG: hypothetical protein R3D58_21540 [Saprospiraceae bacterium]|jgi:hypothetical protein|nr:hypothetical protein [Lewinellaceae bacterium]
MPVLEERLSNAQLELLKLFTGDISEAELHLLKRILLRFRAEVLMDKADRIWEEKGWTDEDIKRLLETKMRISYRQKAK